MSSAKKIALKSSDGQAFEVDVSAASESQTIKQVIESGGAGDNVITLPNITGKILSKVIEYCKKQGEAPPAMAEELKAWEGEFVKVDTETLLHLAMAAHHLNITGLLDLTAGAVAESIKDKTSVEVRKIFNIENDFTPEEEEEIRRETERSFQ